MSEDTKARSEKVCTFTFKKSLKQTSSRKRRGSGESSSSEDETVVVKKEKLVDMSNPLVQRTSLKTATKARHRESSDEEPDSAAGADINVSYKSSRTAKREGPDDMGATATVEIDTALDRDAQAVFERARQLNKEMKDKEDDKVYRGMSNYQQFIEKKDTAAGNASSGHVRKGPIRAPAHLRATVRWDYQPDICKDFKETGYCGFGDSCKFIHDRGDYKHGWQLEREELAASKAGNSRGSGGNDDDSDGDVSKYEIPDEDEERLPFKCLLCRNSFKNPVVTKCRHYFCEKCALDHYGKSQRCFVCSAQTLGIFNPAKEIIARMQKQPQNAALESSGADDEGCKDDSGRPSGGLSSDDDSGS